MESKNKQKHVRLPSVMVSPCCVKWANWCDVDKVRFKRLQEPDICMGIATDISKSPLSLCIYFVHLEIFASVACVRRELMIFYVPPYK